MPLLQVRDFPQDIYDEIAFEAKMQNRTIAQQTITLIKRALNQEISNQERRRRLLEKTMKMPVSQDAKKIDVVKWIREDRER